MTSETRLTLDLCDMRSVDFLCKKCGGSVAVNPRWQKTLIIPQTCPSCGEPWLTYGSEMHRYLRDLIESIRAIEEMQKGGDFKFEVRVNVPREVSDRVSGEKD